MRILIVTYFYPPIIDAHSYRWAQIAQRWVKEGHEVNVVTRSDEGASKESVEHGVKITRTGFKARRNGPKSPSTVSVTWPQRIKGSVRQVISGIYRRLYWPDSAWHWLPSVLLEMARRRDVKYDMVISYYPCFSAHIAAGFLKKIAKKPDYVWLADYGDPFCASVTMQPNNYALYDGLNRAAERCLARMADKLVLTNEETAREYRQRLNLDSEVEVIPHLADFESNYPTDIEFLPRSSNVVTLRYIGGFHRAVRLPDRLFLLMDKLNKNSDVLFHLELYGPMNGFSESELAPSDKSYITHHGLVSRHKALELMREAEFLVNVDNENCIMTPSKVIECISVGARLVNISNPDVNYRPLNEYCEIGNGISIVDRAMGDDSIAAVREFLLGSRNKGVVPMADVRSVLFSHSVGNIANRYMALAVGNEKTTMHG